MKRLTAAVTGLLVALVALAASQPAGRWEVGPLQCFATATGANDTLNLSHNNAWSVCRQLGGDPPGRIHVVYTKTDAGGRAVFKLRPGANDVRRLSRGVYFICSPEQRESVRIVLVE